MSAPNAGDLKVWWIPQVPMEPFEVPVKTAEEGAALLNVLAEYDAFQFIKKVKPDYCNSGGLMEFDGSDWEDWQCAQTFDDDPGNVFPQESLGWCERLPS